MGGLKEETERKQTRKGKTGEMERKRERVWDPPTYIVTIARDASEITPRITDSNQSKTLRTIRLASTV